MMTRAAKTATTEMPPPPRSAGGISPAAVAQLYRVPDAMRALSLSRSVIYELIRSGRLRSVTEGRARRIPAAAIAEYIALLETEAAQETCQ